MKIFLENVSKSFDGKLVINNFSMKVNEGEMVAIMGESGAGKSTILNIIGTIENVDKGMIFYNDKKCISKKDKVNLLRNEIGYLFQNYGLVDNETVFENLLLVMKFDKLSKKDIEQKISCALEKTGLGGYEKRKIHSLSGGEQQRVAIAKLFVKKCSLVLADEPTGNLDKKNTQLVIKLLKDLNIEKTIIIVTHEQDVADNCMRVITV